MHPLFERPSRPITTDWQRMADDFTFSITTTRFDEDYSPSVGSRITTNFANLARGEHRQENLRNALTMMRRRFNDLADWDNPDRDRYALELEIVSVQIQPPRTERISSSAVRGPRHPDPRPAERSPSPRHRGKQLLLLRP